MRVFYFRHIPTVKCERCELRYPKEESACTHCHSLSESGIKLLKLRTQREAEAHVKLGKVMFGIAAIIALFLFWSFSL